MCVCVCVCVCVCTQKEKGVIVLIVTWCENTMWKTTLHTRNSHEALHPWLLFFSEGCKALPTQAYSYSSVHTSQLMQRERRCLTVFAYSGERFSAEHRSDVKLQQCGLLFEMCWEDTRCQTWQFESKNRRALKDICLKVIGGGWDTKQIRGGSSI